MPLFSGRCSYSIKRWASKGSGRLLKETVEAAGPISISSIIRMPRDGFKLSSGVTMTRHMVVHPKFVLEWNVDNRLLDFKRHIPELFSLAKFISPVPEMVIFGTGSKTVQLSGTELAEFFDMYNIPFESMSTVRNEHYIVCLL